MGGGGEPGARERAEQGVAEAPYPAVSSGAGAGEHERQQLLGQREAGVDSIGASGAGTKQQQQQQQQQGDRNSSARQRGGARCTRVGWAVSGARRWWSAMHALFGGNFLGSIAVVYFLQGSRVGFTYLATDYYYRDPVDGLGLSPAEAQALIAVSGLPWSVKPLFGVLCDAVPLCGTHRKGYLGLMGTLGTVGYVLMAVLPPQRWLCTAALFLCSLGSAFCDVVVDAMVASGAKQEPATAAGNLQSLAWSAYAVGSILGSVIGGMLYSFVGARVILGMFGALYSLTILLALNLKEAPAQPLSWESVLAQGRLLGRTLRTPIVAKAVLYTFIMYAAVPATSSGTFYFWTDQDACRGCDDHGVNHWEGVVLPAPQPPQPGGGDQAAATAAGDVRVGCEWFRERGQSVGVGDACRAPLAWLNSSEASDALLSSAWDNCPEACAECGVNGRGCIGFSAAFLGATRAASYVAYLGGVVLYNARYKLTPFRTILCWAWLAHALSLVPDLALVLRLNAALGLPDELFLVGDHMLVSAIGQLKHLPFLVLAARLCPPSIEATFFAALMSVANWGGDVAQFGGAGLLSAVGVSTTNFDRLWLALVIRIGCCLVPALLVFVLVPSGGPADAVSQFQAEIAKHAPSQRGGGYTGLVEDEASADDAGPAIKGEVT